MTQHTVPQVDQGPLKPSPLIRVLAQVRWPVMSGFALDNVADELATRIGRDYPLREKAQELGFLLTPEGVTPQSGGWLHRFSDGDRKWTVTFAATFVTLETSDYQSHAEFIPKFVDVVREVKNHLPLQRWDRFGYRYTNRISDPTDIESLGRFFDSAIMGTLALSFEDSVVHSVSETVYEGADGSLLVKSAYLPPNASLDPTIPPVDTPSWVLDLDAFANGPSSLFLDDEISRQADALSKKAHNFFERVITASYRARFVS